MKIKGFVLIAFIVVIFLGCNENKNSKEIKISRESEEFREDDYQKVQGIVLMIDPSEENESSSNTERNIYYVYNLNLKEPLLGVERNSELMFNEDDLVTVMVNKNDQDISFINQRGMIDQEVLYQFLKRVDSTYYRMKDRVPFD